MNWYVFRSLAECAKCAGIVPANLQTETVPAGWTYEMRNEFVIKRVLHRISLSKLSLLWCFMDWRTLRSVNSCKSWKRAFYSCQNNANTFLPFFKYWLKLLFIFVWERYGKNTLSILGRGNFPNNFETTPSDQRSRLCVSLWLPQEFHFFWFSSTRAFATDSPL